MSFLSFISEQIESATGLEFKAVSARPVSGGDINSAFCLEGQNQRYFVKQNRADLSAMFAAEF
ncbi:MAG: fructosamine kinase family protein, partial [Methylococcaceae bacterium]